MWHLQLVRRTSRSRGSLKWLSSRSRPVKEKRDGKQAVRGTGISTRDIFRALCYSTVRDPKDYSLKGRLSTEKEKTLSSFLHLLQLPLS